MVPFFLEPAEIIDNFNPSNLNAVMKIGSGEANGRC